MRIARSDNVQFSNGWIASPVNDARLIVINRPVSFYFRLPCVPDHANCGNNVDRYACLSRRGEGVRCSVYDVYRFVSRAWIFSSRRLKVIRGKYMEMERDTIDDFAMYHQSTRWSNRSFINRPSRNLYPGIGKMTFQMRSSLLSLTFLSPSLRIFISKVSGQGRSQRGCVT